MPTSTVSHRTGRSRPFQIPQTLPVRGPAGNPSGGEYSPSLYLALKISEHFEVPFEFIFSAESFPRIGSGERSA